MLCISEKLVHKERILLFTMQSILQPILRSQASIQLFCFDCNVLFVEKNTEILSQKAYVTYKVDKCDQIKISYRQITEKMKLFSKMPSGSNRFFDSYKSRLDCLLEGIFLQTIGFNDEILWPLLSQQSD